VVVKRLRGRKLQQRRRRWFALNPLCVSCKDRGIVRLATELDHIKPLDFGGADEPSNWQGLCTQCHDYKTRRDLGRKGSGACDANGQPLDPDHPWNRST